MKLKRQKDFTIGYLKPILIVLASVKQMCIKQINKFGVSKFRTTNKLCCDWVH
jgi:hypothetical protein